MWLTVILKRRPFVRPGASERGLDRPQEIISFREELQKLTEENRRLRDRLTLLEEKYKGGSPGSKRSEKSISH